LRHAAAGTRVRSRPLARLSRPAEAYRCLVGRRSDPSTSTNIISTLTLVATLTCGRPPALDWTPMSEDEPSLRERKKAKTRLSISQIATKMFNERGFDDVTVAEVAAAAEVSVATVFNYFETKEDLFFDREGEIIAAHRRFVRERKAGESVTEALRRAFHAAIDADALPRIVSGEGRFVRTIDASPALRARARLMLDRTEAALAETIAEETGAAEGDPRPRAVAAIVVAIERLLMEDARATVLRGDASPTAMRRLRRTCDRAFELLEGGLRGYGRRAIGAHQEASGKPTAPSPARDGERLARRRS
jgi:AcrR family transcriptional regulator